MGRARLAVVVGAAFAAVACDPTAKSSPGVAPVPAAGRRSLEHESCGRLDENDDFDRAVVQIVEPPASDVGAAEARCVRGAVLPLASEIVRKVAEEASWTATITFEIAG